MKQFIATRAVIINEGKVLAIRESSDYKDGTQCGMYDFPGGKVEPGEKIEDALRREVLEEAGLEINIKQPFYTDEWHPKINGEEVQIIAVYFICDPKSLEVKLGTDHDEYKWINIADIENYPLLIENINAMKAYSSISTK